MNIKKLERELMREIEEKQELLRRAKQQGFQPSLDHQVDAAPVNGFSLEPVFKYMYALQQMPRALLVARFEKDTGQSAPNAPRQWLIEKMVRKLQREVYERAGREIPKSLRERDRAFDHLRPRILEPGEFEPTEPRDEIYYDPDLKLKAAGPNPFDRGKAWIMFEIVNHEGSKGISIRALEVMLERALNIARPAAQKRAQKMFTKWVQRGWLRLA